MAAKGILNQVREFFGMTMPEMNKEWRALSDEDKAQIKAGIEDGTLTY